MTGTARVSLSPHPSQSPSSVVRAFTRFLDRLNLSAVPDPDDPLLLYVPEAPVPLPSVLTYHPAVMAVDV